MSWLVLACGVLGLAAIVYGFVALCIDARRRRRYGDILLGVGVAIVVVAALVALGDRLLQ